MFFCLYLTFLIVVAANFPIKAETSEKGLRKCLGKKAKNYIIRENDKFLIVKPKSRREFNFKKKDRKLKKCLKIKNPYDRVNTFLALSVNTEPNETEKGKWDELVIELETNSQSSGLV